MINIIKEDFNGQAIDFILLMRSINNEGEIKIIDSQSDLKKLNHDEILKIYSEEHRELQNKLMWHRNVPVSEEYLKKLSNNFNILPRAIKIILDSILPKHIDRKYLNQQS